LNAGLDGIVSIAVNPSGVAYFSDGQHQTVFLIDSQGNLQVVAGVPAGLKTATPPYISAGPATSAVFSEANNMMFDAQGNLYFDVADGLSNTQIVVVDDSGNLTPIGGAPVVTAAISLGDGGDANLGAFASVRGLAIDGVGNIYVSDTGIIRKMSPFNPSSPPPFISANGIVGAGGSVPAVEALRPAASSASSARTSSQPPTPKPLAPRPL
jgi:serine/threonine protein kinase, bacterial